MSGMAYASDVVSTSSAMLSCISWAVARARLARLRKARLARRRIARSSATGLANLASIIAGSKRRPGLRDEWRSHLAGDGREPPGWQTINAAFGFVWAALKMRLRDLADLAWWPADRVLGSRTLSNLFVLGPTVAVAVAVFFHVGAIGVMMSMESIGATGGLLYGAIRCGRAYRDVRPPAPRPRAKD
jgi:hypothetical protein